MGMGEVVRWVKVLPSESVTSCVKVYGRFGRRSSEACRICWQVIWVAADTLVRRRSGWGSIVAVVDGVGN